MTETHTLWKKIKGTKSGSSKTGHNERLLLFSLYVSVFFFFFCDDTIPVGSVNSF